jgi:hypothetical protein
VTGLASQPSDDLANRAMSAIHVSHISKSIGADPVAQPALDFSETSQNRPRSECQRWGAIGHRGQPSGSLCSQYVLVNPAMDRQTQPDQQHILQRPSPTSPDRSRRQWSPIVGQSVGATVLRTVVDGRWRVWRRGRHSARPCLTVRPITPHRATSSPNRLLTVTQGGSPGRSREDLLLS